MTRPDDAPRCQDFGDREGCLEEPDERYTMRFDDIGEPPIRWCSHCGPEAHAMDALLVAAFRTNPNLTIEILERELDEIDKEMN